MRKLKKILIIIISTIIIIVAAVIICISPITKYLIQKYDEKYTGRQITLGWAYVNPFTGYLHFSNLKIYELKSDSIFFSADGVSANFAMLKLLSKTYEISKITLDHPRGIIIQNKKDFNFSDLIKKFSPKENRDTTKAPVHFSILNAKIMEGEFYFREELIPINYFIKEVNIESTGKHWDEDTITAQFSLLPGIGSGDMNGDFTINLNNDNYKFSLVAHKFDLNIIEQYLKDLTNYGSFTANLDADVQATGNFKDQENLTTSGKVAINEFHFGKNPKEDYASFDKLSLAIIELSPKNYKYLFDSISLLHPFFKYEIYDSLDNLQTMFGRKGSNIKAASADPAKFNLIVEIARYVKVLANNFFRSDYKINRLEIYNGDIEFNDFSTSEKFAMELDPLTVVADSIDNLRDRVEVSLKSDIKPYGKVSVALSMNPKDSTDFNLQYHFQNLPVTMFNPYTITYTSFPLDRGTLEFKGNWIVRNGMIQSHNHLVILDPRVTIRLRNKDIKWIPVPLIMSFIRERGNVIDYEIPITGSLKDPKFHWIDVIFDLLGNIFVKPATIPYNVEVKNVETEIEKTLTLKWATRQASLLPSQETFIKKTADFLVKNPGAFITVYPQQYAIKEKEYILFFEAKKVYYLLTKNMKAQSFNEEDSEMVNNMSVKDASFVKYLNKLVKDTLLFTIQEKCSVLIDSAHVNARYNQLNTARKNSFISYFKEVKAENQVKFSSGENVIPYNGFSFYKIEYMGDFPQSLIKAYHKMNDLNDKAPRKIFQEERKKSGSPLNENQ